MMSQALYKQWKWFSSAILRLQMNQTTRLRAALIERCMQFDMIVPKEAQKAQTQNFKIVAPMLRGSRGNGSKL